jgi:long-subunit acyl-CoA synthetase (AMP-forming)
LAPGSAIAILGKNSAHWIIADLAIWLAGHVSAPIYPGAGAATVAYVLGHSEAKLLFVGRRKRRRLAERVVPPGAGTMRRGRFP